MKQLDVFRDSPQVMAQAFRVAAETARTNPYFTPDFAEERARYYAEQAERLESRK